MVGSCHMTSTLRAFRSKSHIITIASFSDTSSVECGTVEKKLKWELGEKSPNLIMGN